MLQKFYKSPGEMKGGIQTDKRRTAAGSNICTSNHDRQPLRRGCEAYEWQQRKKIGLTDISSVTSRQICISILVLPTKFFFSGFVKVTGISSCVCKYDQPNRSRYRRGTCSLVKDYRNMQSQHMHMPFFRQPQLPHFYRDQNHNFYPNILQIDQMRCQLRL